MDVFRYQYGGLVFQSAAALPLAPDIDPDRPADVTVTFGPLPAPKTDCIRSKPHFQMHADGTCILRTPQGIRFLFDNGRALWVEVPEGLDRRLVQSWLVGPGLGILLHQRGLPPLHSCAVTLGECAVAIAGDSGAGKSTTARALMRRGHRLLAEDQAVIDPAARRIWPGAPGLRLWAEAAGVFGDPMTEEMRVEAGEDKFTIAPGSLFDPQPRPLTVLFILSSDHAVERPVAERLGTAAAMASLHRHVYRLRLATFMGAASVIFHWAAALAAGVPVFALSRPRDLSRLDELAAHIEQITGNGA